MGQPHDCGLKVELQMNITTGRNTASRGAWNRTLEDTDPVRHRHGVTQLAEFRPHKPIVAGSSPASVTTSPGRRHPLFILLLALAFAPGCTTSKILTSTNNWAYYTARVNETPEPCRHAALTRWKAALDEVNEASNRGGRYPLQLRALALSEKQYGGCANEVKTPVPAKAVLREDLPGAGLRLVRAPGSIYDGCNYRICNEAGFCYVTAMYCGDTTP